jgi:hypothetical protein
MSWAEPSSILPTIEIFIIYVNDEWAIVSHRKTVVSRAQPSAILPTIEIYNLQYTNDEWAIVSHRKWAIVSQR